MLTYVNKKGKRKMNKGFDLETILSVTTGVSLVDDFNKVLELAQYIYNDKLINDFALVFLKDDLRDYILECHKELAGLCPPPSYVYYKGPKQIKISLLSTWIDEQKKIFGTKLELAPKNKNAILKK